MIRNEKTVVLQDLPAEYIEILRWLRRAVGTKTDRRAMTLFHLGKTTITTMDGYRIHQADFGKTINYPFPAAGAYKVWVLAYKIVLMERVDDKLDIPDYRKLIRDAQLSGMPLNKLAGNWAIFARVDPFHLRDASSIRCQGLQLQVGNGGLVLSGVKPAALGDVEVLSVVMPLSSGRNGRKPWATQMTRPDNQAISSADS